MTRFLLVNFLTGAVAVAAWRGGLMGWAYTLPHDVWLILGFMGAVLTGGLIAVALGRTDIAYHCANGLPQIGLLGTGLALQSAASGITTITPEAAFSLFHGIILSMPPTVAGVFGLLVIREAAFWCSGDHV